MCDLKTNRKRLLLEVDKMDGICFRLQKSGAAAMTGSQYRLKTFVLSSLEDIVETLLV